MEHQKRIDAAQHGQPLYMLSEMPSGDEHVKKFEKELKDYLAAYHETLSELAETVRGIL